MATDKLNALQVFRRVAELGSFTKAADDLNITAATVSKHIAFLEEDLQTRLINRTTRRMNLTDAGINFLARTQALLDDLEAAEQEVKGLQAGLSGTLRINAPMSFGLTHMTEAIDHFLMQHPNIQIDLQLNDHIIDLVQQGVDIAIRVRQKLSDSSLIARPLRQTRNVICAAPSYLSRSPKLETPADLQAHNCLQFSLHAKPGVWHLGKQDWPVRGNYKADNSLVLRQSLINGLGVGNIPQFLVQTDLEERRLVLLLADFPAVPNTVYALFPPGRKQPAKVRLFLEHLDTYLGTKPYWE